MPIRDSLDALQATCTAILLLPMEHAGKCKISRGIEKWSLRARNTEGNLDYPKEDRALARTSFPAFTHALTLADKGLFAKSTNKKKQTTFENASRVEISRRNASIL